MKLSVAKKVVLVVGAALIGIALLAGVGEQHVADIFEAASGGNVNLVPNLPVRQSYGRHRP